MTHAMTDGIRSAMVPPVAHVVGVLCELILGTRFEQSLRVSTEHSVHGAAPIKVQLQQFLIGRQVQCPPYCPWNAYLYVKWLHVLVRTVIEACQKWKEDGHPPLLCPLTPPPAPQTRRHLLPASATAGSGGGQQCSRP